MNRKVTLLFVAALVVAAIGLPFASSQMGPGRPGPGGPGGGPDAVGPGGPDGGPDGPGGPGMGQPQPGGPGRGGPGMGQQPGGPMGGQPGAGMRTGRMPAGGQDQFGTAHENMPPEFQRMGGMINVIDRMGEAVFNPRVAGMIAVGALKDETSAKPGEKIAVFEDLLGKTKSQGLRNALRIALKDLYKAQGDEAKMVEQLKAMVLENDKILQEHEAAAAAAAKKRE